MAQIITLDRLTEQEKKDLQVYARTLKKYISPELSRFYPLGGKQLPKSLRLEAEEVFERRETLQEKFDIGWKWDYHGQWKLEMVGANETPGSAYCDEGYWNILPLNSGRKKILEYLAGEVLPRVFRGKKFSVRDTMIPCDGDCSWDCV